MTMQEATNRKPDGIEQERLRTITRKNGLITEINGPYGGSIINSIVYDEDDQIVEATVLGIVSVVRRADGTHSWGSNVQPVSNFKLCQHTGKISWNKQSRFEYIGYQGKIEKEHELL